MIRLRDDRKRLHHWISAPRRIVSLVPSDTYTLVRLGVGDRLIGRTRYCAEPADYVAGIEIVGGTKDADIGRILDLKPDLIVANQEENSQRDIERLEAEGLAVYVSFPKRFAQGIAHIARLAVLLGLEKSSPTARALVAGAYRIHTEAQEIRREKKPLRAFVPIWMDPLMTIHGDTFISDMLDLAGAWNIFEDRPRRYPLAADIGDAEELPLQRIGNRDTRYPRISLQEVIERQPDIILLPDEPHAFSEKDAEIFRNLPTPAGQFNRIVFCDGKDLMWYGQRAVEGLPRLRALIDSHRDA